MRKVLVLNTTYEPLNVCSVRRALVLLLKDKAEAARAVRRGTSAPSTTPSPSRTSSACSTYVRVPRDPSARISRRAVFARDRHRCQYCGSERHLTVDHVVPRSKGGADTLGERRHLVRALQPQEGRPACRTSPTCASRAPPRPPEPFSFVLLHVDDIHETLAARI